MTVLVNQHLVSTQDSHALGKINRENIECPSQIGWIAMQLQMKGPILPTSPGAVESSESKTTGVSKRVQALKPWCSRQQTKEKGTKW